MDILNSILQTLHNLARWALLILAILVIIRSFRGWMNQSTYTDRDKKTTAIFTGIFDMQILIGAILFFSKGWGSVLINSGSSVMSTPAVRFFIVEHWSMMLLAVIAAHIGSAQVKKTSESAKKYLRASIWFSVSFILVLAAIPWPGMAASRPLFRLFGIVF